MATLTSLSVGTSVYLNVKGVKTEFLVVHQGLPSNLYDASCNGTWLLMRRIYEKRQWNGSAVNDYENSDIHKYLNSAFLAGFDIGIQSAIKQVKIPYRPGSGTGKTANNGANGLLAKIFLLSSAEVSFGDSTMPTNEGSELAYFAGLSDTNGVSGRKAYLDDGATVAEWWLRSPHCGTNTTYTRYINTSGSGYGTLGTNQYGIRPALILPGDLSVDTSTNEVIAPIVHQDTHKTCVHNVEREIEGGTVLLGGTIYEIDNGVTLIGGVAHDIEFSGRKPLSTLSAGSIVYIKENGINIPFLLLTHDYEAGLNGSGRTLLVRRDGYDMRTFDNSVADFPNSAICTWLNGTYKALFSGVVQTLMGQTQFGYWKQSTTNTTVVNATKSVFLLSITEAVSYSWVSPDGTYIPAVDLRITLSNETTKRNWHTRSAVRNKTATIYSIASSGAQATGTVTNSRASRPCFTLPDTALIDPATNELIE